MKRILFVLLIGAICNGDRAFGDFLQGSATLTSVSSSLTVGSGTFPPIFSGGWTGTGAVWNGIATQDATVFPGTPVRIGPAQITDPATGSVAQTTATVNGQLVNGNASFNLTTSAFSSAASAFTAGAVNFVGTSTITLGPLQQATPATLNIDLMSDLVSNPTSAFALQALEAGSVGGDHSIQVTISTIVDSNLSNAPRLFGLIATALVQNGVTTLSVDCFSPFITQPIFASDFIAGPNGLFSLDPNKRSISIPFTIPSGKQFQFDVGTQARVQIVPEPASFIPALFALISLLGFGRKRR